MGLGGLEVRSLGNVSTEKEMRVEWDEESNVRDMQDQGKQAMVESTREVYISVRVGGKKPQSMCWNDVVNSVVERNEAACKEVLGARDGVAKERCMEAYKKEKKAKKCVCQRKKVSHQFGRKMNQNVSGNRKF